MRKTSSTIIKKASQKSDRKLSPIWNSTLPVASYKDILGKELTQGRNNMFEGLSSIMPNPLPLLKKLGWNKDVEVFQEVENEVFAAITNRKAGTLRLQWDIFGENEKEKQVIKDIFDRLDIHALINKALDTPYYGREIFGTVWDAVDGVWSPIQVEAIPLNLTKFNDRGQLLVAETKYDYEYLPPAHIAKYLLLRHENALDNPYGNPVLAKCYWNVLFKKEGNKLWGMFIEKFGLPNVTAKYNTMKLANSFKTDAQTAADILLSNLSQMARGGTIIFPEGVELSITEPKTSSSEIFEKMVRYCDEQNTKILLGHSGATESTSGDKLSNDTTATDVRDHIIQSDKKYPTKLINDLIYWIHEFNFSGPCPKFEMFSEAEVDIKRAERDNKLYPVLERSGLKLTKSYYINDYGFKDTDLEDAPIPDNKSNNLGIAKNNLIKSLIKNTFNQKNNASKDEFPDQALIDNFTDLAVEENVKIFENLTSIVTEYVNKQSDYSKTLEGIAKLFPKMDNSRLTRCFN